MSGGGGRRKGGARAALVHAFNHVFLARRTHDPRVSDVVAQAGVARSTFYDHYAGIDELHLAALSRPLAALADAIAGIGEPAALDGLLLHFRENRDRARTTLRGEMRAKVERLLAGMVQERLGPATVTVSGVPARLAALQLAGAQLALIRAWLAGESHCEPAALASAIRETSASLRASLFAARRQPGDAGR